jgi:hypothetical protein
MQQLCSSVRSGHGIAAEGLDKTWLRVPCYGVAIVQQLCTAAVAVVAIVAMLACRLHSYCWAL